MLGRLIDKFKKGLAKTREGMVQKIREVIRMRPKLDEETLEEIEEILIQADVGGGPTLRIIDQLRERIESGEPVEDPETAVQEFLEEEIRKILQPEESAPPSAITAKPHVILIVGVNGVGKTTTIGKMAHKFNREGKKVILAAGDTFRAAAIDQLDIWAERSGADIVSHQPGADAASVAFDAIQAAQARDADIVLIDTAGRLHTKINLMEEVKKIRRVVDKAMPGAPHETLLVLDATTGQNAVTQAKQFHNTVELSGLVLAKLDGTAKGGVVIAIADEFDLPVRFVGLGEGLEDLDDFDPETFVKALFEA
ncbi:MAG: signal recognition particle-docking protein FtsY [Candidatus Latescibacteria bacterium]|nr:signal recognition particle-docking protein FtsY [Candidatus Latescibacterota bacterium]